MTESEREAEEELERTWRDEILRRIEEMRLGEVTPEPWFEVRRQMREARRR